MVHVLLDIEFATDVYNSILFSCTAISKSFGIFVISDLSILSRNTSLNPHNFIESSKDIYCVVESNCLKNTIVSSSINSTFSLSKTYFANNSKSLYVIPNTPSKRAFLMSLNFSGAKC